LKKSKHFQAERSDFRPLIILKDKAIHIVVPVLGCIPMDEKKMAGFRNAAKKLIDMNVPQEEIVAAMHELGLGVADAGKIVQEIMDGSRPINRENEPKNTLVQSGHSAGTASLIAAMEMSPKDEDALNGRAADYIPHLHKGGRGKVHEIIVESPIGLNGKNTPAQGIGGQAEIIGKLESMEHKIEELQKQLGESPKGKNAKKGKVV